MKYNIDREKRTDGPIKNDAPEYSGFQMITAKQG